MAELAKKGTYVRLLVNVWWDKSNKRIHITSNDPDLPANGMHMSAKPGTMSDTNLRVLLDDFGCGPTTLAVTQAPDTLNEFMEYVDRLSPSELLVLKAQLELRIVSQKNGG